MGYAGLSLQVVDPATDDVREIRSLGGPIGVGDVPYVEATWSYALPDGSPAMSIQV